MANVKISNLTAATTPVAGTEVLPIVQSGATVKVSIANLTPGLSTITTAKGGTGLTSFTANGVVYASSSSALTTGSALVFDGTNLGVGVTPSAWTTYKAVQVGPFAAFADSTSGNTELSSNRYNASGDKYIGSGYASMLRQSDGMFKFFTAASGTAGNAISFTQAMTLDASSNLGINTTSLNVAGLDKAVTLNGSTSSIYEANVSNGRAAYLYAASQGTVIGEYRAKTLQFTTSDTVRATIDSSGRFLVGVTSPVGSTFSTIQYDAVTYNGFALNTSANTGGARFMLFASVGTQCGVIDRVGTTSAVVYTATSDRRLKENIVDAPSAIEHINAVKVRSYNWIDGGHQVKYGVIAQEFVDVEPDAVVQGDTGETIEKTWSVDTSALVPAMIKAIQEQQALITTLTDRITALEAR